MALAFAPRRLVIPFSPLLRTLLTLIVITSHGLAQSPKQHKLEGPDPVTPKALLKALASPLDTAAQERLHRQIIRSFGHASLVENRASAKVEGTTVAWAVLATKPARLLRDDGKPLGDMIQIGADGLQVISLDLPNFTETNYRILVDERIHQGGQVRIEHFEPTPESLPNSEIPKGSLQVFEWKDSKVFPGTVRQVTVYTPANHNPNKACGLMIWQDGTRHADPNGALRVPVVFDHLIHRGDMPPVIGIFIDPGRKPTQKPNDKAANRSLEYDSLGDAYSRFLLSEILPEVRQRFNLSWSPRPENIALAGGSSGGICAFTAAWERPDQFRKVLSWVGSFTDIRGGHAYPSLIRQTEPKPLRIYLLGGQNDLDNAYGYWPTANKLVASALAFHHYDHHLEWTQCFHGTKGMAPKLPAALRWLWRDWKQSLATTAAN